MQARMQEFLSSFAHRAILSRLTVALVLRPCLIRIHCAEAEENYAADKDFCSTHCPDPLLLLLLVIVEGNFPRPLVSYSGSI